MTAAPEARQSTPAVASAHDKILIVDFGSQVTQLIARRVREEGVYSEIVPFQKAEAAFHEMKPKAVILSGGPESVHEAGSPRAPQAIFDAGVPVLGICYGQMTMAAQLGGEVEGGHHREFGRADLEVKTSSKLFDGIWSMGERPQVWMSHGDRITKMPPGFSVAGISANAPFAVIQDEKRKYYGLMFHPEVVHTPDGAKLLRNFVRNVAGLTGDWSMRAFREEAIEKIRAQVGKGRVICGLSGGVDSAVAAVLIHEAIGDQLTCVFVDHGLLRLDEARTVVDLFRHHYNIPLAIRVPARHNRIADSGKLGRSAEKLKPEALPALDQSDTAIWAALAALFGETPLKNVFQPQEIVRHIVVTVDNLPRKTLATRLLPTKPVAGGFRVAGQAENLAIGAENAARYTPYVRLAEMADAKDIVALYVRFYPLFQSAYQDLGYPEGYFNDRLVAVIDHLLAAPEVAAAPTLVQPHVLYQFADPELEAQSAGRKILLRMGNDNARRVKAKLWQIRAELTGAPKPPA